MKKMLTVLCLIVIAGAFAGAAAAADSPSVPAATEVQAAALPALLDGALSCGALSTQALPLAGAPQTEAVVCCTAADRAACTQECAPLIGKTFCIHGCECYCF